MDPNKKVKKEKIKLLTLRNVEGTQTLYTQIPFFMRTRLAQMIDSIKWEEIKHGCESYNPRSFQEAKEKFCDVLRKIDEYLEEGRNTKNEVETDSLMLMRTDRNFITVTYGNDPVKFVTAMADCIRKEDELIDHYILEDENTNESTSCIDINVEVSTNDLPVIEQVMESVSQELLDIEKNIDELQKMLTSYNSLNSNDYPLLDEFIFDPDQLHSLILNHFDLMLDTMMKYVQVLSMKVAEFRVAKARANVHVGPKAKLDPLAKSFSAFGELLQTVLNWFEPTELLKYFQQNYEEEMKRKESMLYQIKIDLLKCNLVVYKQPKDLMSIESVGNKKGKEESSGSDRLKTKRKYRTKKKNTFETGVRLLGGSCLKDVQIDKAFMYLVAERDMAEGKERDQSTVLTFLTEYINDENFPHHVIFKNVAIESFSRVEQNHIYKQFFRLVYGVHISFKGRKIKVQTHSLPFMFNTGSNQILELIAARMWYCANFDLVSIVVNFSAFGELLQTVLNWFEPTELLKYFQQNYEEEMKRKESMLYQIKIDLLKCNLVVYKQPKDLMSIESVGNKKGKEESSGSDRLKTKRKYRTKKKNTFETGVRLLGGSCLKDVQIDKAFMYLVAERDMAEGKERDQSTVLTFLTEYINDENFPHHVIFKNVAIESFSRVEQNHIYKQFFRLVYGVHISFKGRKIKVQTHSLPFMFNTGSNQILELIAARMWYCANFDLYDGRFHCDDSLDVEIVLKMLADRVANLNPAKPRLLYLDELEFLQTRLPNSSNGKVTMQGFIKDKMKKTRAADQELGFSFHTWFYAVLYCIKMRLLNPWIDGFIYGFCSEATAAELLEKESVGTFILRPSISREINSMSSREACTDLTMDIKLKKDNPSLDENPYFVQSIPILMSSVQKYSLYGAIAGIKKNNEAIAKYCLTRNGKKNIAYLKAYNQGKLEGEYESIKDYRLMVKKMEEIQIKEIGLDTTGNINERNEDAKSGASQRKRPFPGHFTSSSSPTSVCVPAQSSSDASSHWSNTTTTSDPVDMFDQENATFHMSPGSYNVALGLTTASVQGLRSDHQSNSLPVHYDTEHHRYPFLTCLRDSEEEMGHSLQEGYLETCASLILQRIDGTDALSTLLHEYANSKDAGVDIMDNELIETSPYFNNEATSTQNWLCDRSDEYRKYQYVRTNSNLSSAYSSCTNISSPSDSSLGGMHEECLCISPADSGIDRTTPSPPNEYEGNN